MATTEIHDAIFYDEEPGNWPPPGEMHFRLDDDPKITGVQKLGTLNLSCDTGYVVRSYEFASPEMRQVVYPNALDDGTFDVTGFIGARAVTLDMVLRNTTGVDGTGLALLPEAQMRDRLMRYTAPSRRPVLYFSEHGDYEIEVIGGVITQRRRIRKIGLRGSDAPYNVSRPRFNEMTMSWVAPSGVIESTSYHRAEIRFTEADLDAQYIIITNNRGSAPAHWTLTIDGDLETPEIELITPGGRTQRLWLHYHVEEPNAVTVDSRSKTVRVGNKVVGYRYLDDRSDWFRIPVGESRLVLTHSSIAGAGKPFARWQPKTAMPTPANIPQWTTKLTHNRANDDAYLPNPSQYADLIDLKADPAQGDGRYYGKVFGDGDFTILGDGNEAWFNGPPRANSTAPVTTGIWEAGSNPVSVAQWVWSASIDENTPNDPVRSVVTLKYYEAFL